MERAETLLEMYMAEMMPHFPFVILPPHTKADQLRRETPFLFLAILSVASFHSLDTQEQMAANFAQMVSEKVLLGGNDCLRLDYLQGLLIVMAWNQDHNRTLFGSQYQQLAISIAVDMRLDRKYLRSRPTEAGGTRDPIAHPRGHWGSDEKRAAAGVFFLTSTISKLLDKMNTFSCTAFVEQGCLDLRDKADYPTDKDLYHIVQLQKIIENIDQLGSQPNSSEAEAHMAYLQVRSELEAFRAHLASNVNDSHLLFMQFHTAKLFLYHISFFERNLQYSPALNLPILHEGLESTKSFLGLYLWMTPKSELALTNLEWIQLSFGLTIAAKFAIVSREPFIELQTRDVRKKLGIETTFRHFVLRIGALVRRGGETDPTKDVFLQYEQRTRKLQSWYERMLRATRSVGSESLLPQGTTEHLARPLLPAPSLHSNAGLQQAPTLPSQRPVQHHQGQLGQGHHIVHFPAHLMQANDQNPFQGPEPTVKFQGMAPTTSYDVYNDDLTIAFPDLMNAPGWDTLFTMPLEDDGWIYDATADYSDTDALSR